MLDIENLNVRQEFNQLPDTYTIFIVEKDFYGMGKPVYSIERVNLDTGKLFGDGEHILYVNSEYRGDSDIGRLMHDFHCMNAADMHFPLMAERTRYLKENPKGVSEMCRIIEDMRTEERAEGRAEGRINERIENIRNLVKNMQWTIEQAMDALGIAPAERDTYRELLKE